MKLLNRAMIYYMSFMLFIFSVGGIITYHVIRNLVLRQVNQDLLAEKKIIEEQIGQSDTLPDFSGLFDQKIEVRLVKHQVHSMYFFNDTVLTDSSGTRIPYRFLICSGNLAKNRSYFMKTSLPIQEENKLAYDILYTLIFSFLLLIFFLVFINYSISRALLKDFYSLLKNIRVFDLKKASSFVPVSSKIREFQQLNGVLINLTEKISSDYANLKEFSENISHEIQTPLSIIRSRVEYLYQSPDLNKKNAEDLNTINQSVTRISRINQALILISRIGNDQFPKITTVLLGKRLKEHLYLFSDLIESKKITCTLNEEDDVSIKINSDLADIMLANLISNAVRHNVPGGSIKITLNSDELVMENTGRSLDVDPDSLFQRFSKADSESLSPGLGLAIIRKIVELYAMKIEYNVTGILHRIRIIFPKQDL